MPQEVAIHIVCNALNGLQYAHSLTDYDGAPLHIVHRDLSPHNIFLTYDGGVKLVDFGIAKAANNAAKTQDGMLKGKLKFMAPEQIGGEVDCRTDIFTLGNVLWELIAGKPLFRSDGGTTMRELLSAAPLPALSSVAPDAPPELVAIVSRALEKKPENRYATAQER